MAKGMDLGKFKNRDWVEVEARMAMENHPAYQGKGLGSFFFRFVEENRPAARYRLEVEPENTGAVRLYERLGYRALPYAQMIKEKTV